MKVLAIIPARGGSKGVPRKNIIDIEGKPLICYSIETGLEAKEIGSIDRVIVSTDDEEIANISRVAGADVPFLRPDYLSNDNAKSIDVMIHAYEFCKKSGDEYDTILLLQPTSPLRTSEDISNALSLYSKTKATSLISCYKEEYICDLVSYHRDNNMAIALNEKHNCGGRRQELPDLYVRNGSIYITSVEQMLINHRVFDDVPAMYVMPKNRSVNIDCMDDVEMLRWMLSRKKMV